MLKQSDTEMTDQPVHKVKNNQISQDLVIYVECSDQFERGRVKNLVASCKWTSLKSKAVRMYPLILLIRYYFYIVVILTMQNYGFAQLYFLLGF